MRKLLGSVGWMAALLAPAAALAQPGSFAIDAPASGAAPVRAEAPVVASLATPPAVASRDSQPAVDYLWVVRTSLVDPADIPRVVERARSMGARGLLVQVVGRGDAWYRSELLPPPEAIADTARDPLGELLPLAHAAGLEVHAWVNTCLVWSADRLPRDPRHVLRAHPEWVARMSDGRSMLALTPRARQRLQVEGVFLSPAHPAVRSHLARVAQELVSRYPVDGIHLDYIRQPSVEIGFDPTSRARFALEHAADPAHFGRLDAAARAAAEQAWEAFQRAQVTAIVRELRDSVEQVRPGLPLSAAVLADTASAQRRNRQDWSGWLRAGLLDRAFPMCYAPPVQTVLDQLVAMSSQFGVDRVVPGFAVYNSSPSAAAAKIKGARALGYPSVALYSYDSLFERADLWARLREHLVPTAPLEVIP